MQDGAVHSGEPPQAPAPQQWAAHWTVELQATPPEQALAPLHVVSQVEPAHAMPSVHAPVPHDRSQVVASVQTIPFAQAPVPQSAAHAPVPQVIPLVQLPCRQLTLQSPAAQVTPESHAELLLHVTLHTSLPHNTGASRQARSPRHCNVHIAAALQSMEPRHASLVSQVTSQLPVPQVTPD